MEKKKDLTQVVTLVTIPRYLPVLMWPQFGDYNNHFIRKTQPCEKRDGKFYDLRTGQPVKKTGTMLEWPNLSGSYFRYPDGTELLLARRFKDNQLMLMEVKDEYNPATMMFRQLVERVEKKAEKKKNY